MSDIIVDIVNALADAVRTGMPSDVAFQSYPAMPDSPLPPCFAIGAIEIDPFVSFGGDDLLGIDTYVFVPHTGDPIAAQAGLARYCSRSDARSVRAIIEAQRRTSGTRALGGLAAELKIGKISGWREFLFGDNRRIYGAQIPITVWL